MDILKIEGSDDTPAVLLDKVNGIFEISGRSLPEDVVEFYKPVLAWIEAYSKQPNETTDFSFKLEYFNTASSKLIQDILEALDNIQGVKVSWYFREDDESMEESGNEFSESVSIPFDFKNL